MRSVGGDQIHPLALPTRLSLLLRTLFSGWVHCRNAKSTVKLTKMIDFEVADSNMACGRGLCYQPGGQKAASRGISGWFSIYTQYSTFTQTLKSRESLVYKAKR